MTPSLSHCEPLHEPTMTACTVLQTTCVTACVLLVFIAFRTLYERIRQQHTLLTVVIIGAGPIGLLAALLASQNPQVNRILLYEEKSRRELLTRPQQVTFTAVSVKFLKAIGIDLDCIEGRWHNKCFLTPIAVFQEYLLEVVGSVADRLDLRLDCKVRYHNLLYTCYAFKGHLNRS